MKAFLLVICTVPVPAVYCTEDRPQLRTFVAYQVDLGPEQQLQQS